MTRQERDRPRTGLYRQEYFQRNYSDLPLDLSTRGPFLSEETQRGQIVRSHHLNNQRGLLELWQAVENKTGRLANGNYFLVDILGS